MADIYDMQYQVFKFVQEKGWNDDRTVGDSIALLHSEVSEALEAYRKWGLEDPTEKGHKPEGFASEFADILIRLLDDCERYNIDIVFEFNRKMDYNRKRSYRHGGKLL